MINFRNHVRNDVSFILPDNLISSGEDSCYVEPDESNDSNLIILFNFEVLESKKDVDLAKKLYTFRMMDRFSSDCAIFFIRQGANRKTKRLEIATKQWIYTNYLVRYAYKSLFSLGNRYIESTFLSGLTAEDFDYFMEIVDTTLNSFKIINDKE